MDMNSRKILILIGLALAALLLTIVAVCRPSPKGLRSHHGMFHMMGLSGIVGG